MSSFKRDTDHSSPNAPCSCDIIQCLSEVVVITRILRVYASGEKSLYMLVGLCPGANPIDFCMALFPIVGFAYPSFASVQSTRKPQAFLIEGLAGHVMGTVGV